MRLSVLIDVKLHTQFSSVWQWVVYEMLVLM